MNPAVSRRCYGLEKARAQVNVCISAALACVDNCSLRGTPGRGVEDRDCLATLWVLVRVGSVVHQCDRESHNGLAVVVRDPTRAKTSCVMRDVTSIWMVGAGIEWYGRG